MKQQPSQFGQARQLAEARQQLAGLKEQAEKLTADIKALRDLDRQIFDDQDKEISELKKLIESFVALLKDEALMIEASPDGWWEDREIALLSAQQLLKES